MPASSPGINVGELESQANMLLVPVLQSVVDTVPPPTVECFVRESDICTAEDRDVNGELPHHQLLEM
jgi:hypothetical protein